MAGVRDGHSSVLPKILKLFFFSWKKSEKGEYWTIAANFQNINEV